MYARSWWEKQRKVNFANDTKRDIPPFGVGLRYQLPANVINRATYLGASYRGERNTPNANFLPTGFIFNGPFVTKAWSPGVGSFSWPAIARVRSELSLAPGIGLGYGEPLELD